MPKRCIGIDIGRSHVRAVQIARTPEGLCLEKTFATQMRRSMDSLSGILHSLTTEHDFDRRAEVAVALPHQAFFFANIEADTAGLERLRSADTAGLKDYFPIPQEEIVAQVCSIPRSGANGSSVLVAATSCETLRDELHLLNKGRVRLTRIDTPVTAAHAGIIADYPEAAAGTAVILYVGESIISLTVVQDGGIRLVRSFPMFPAGGQGMESLAQQTSEIVVQEIEITWRRLFARDLGTGLRVFLIASREMVPLLASSITEKANCQVIPADSRAGIARSEAVDTGFPLCVAQGLALRTLEADPARHIDFLAAYRARTEPRVKTRKELTVCTGLALAAAAVWLIGVFLHLSTLESQHTRLKKQAEAIFHRAAPEERAIVDPIAQLRQRVESLRQDAELFTCFSPGRPAPLEVLSMLSRQTPAGGSLKLNDVLIAMDSIRITGTCDRFETLSEWQRLLEKTPGLRIVDVANPRKDIDSGRVQFTVSLATTGRRG